MGPWYLRQAISEIAERGARNYRDRPESYGGNARVRVQIVEHQDESNHRGDRGDDKHKKQHEASVDHVDNSLRRARAPRTKPMKKP